MLANFVYRANNATLPIRQCLPWTVYIGVACNLKRSPSRKRSCRLAFIVLTNAGRDVCIDIDPSMRLVLGDVHWKDHKAARLFLFVARAEESSPDFPRTRSLSRRRNHFSGRESTRRRPSPCKRLTASSATSKPSKGICERSTVAECSVGDAENIDPFRCR